MRHKLRVIREAMKLTQNEVAEKLGVSRSYYTELELGRKQPSLDLLRRFVDMFGPGALDIFLPK